MSERTFDDASCVSRVSQVTACRGLPEGGPILSELASNPATAEGVDWHLAENPACCPRLNKSRLGWVDTARGICTCIVIFGHVIANARDARLIAQPSIWTDLFYFIYTFHMPAFMFLCGLFVQRRLQNGAVRFLRPLFATLAWPYLLWGSAILLAEWLGQKVRSPVDTSSVDVSLLWTPIAWLWFLWVLGLFHVVAASVARFPTGLIAIGLLAQAVDALGHLPPLLHGFCYFLIFYAAGVVLGPRVADLRLSGHQVAIAGVATIPLAVFAMKTGSAPWSLAAVPAAIAGIVSIYGMSRQLSANTLLNFLGRRSMPLYVVHIFFIAATRVFLTRIIGTNSFAVLLPACLIAAFAGPLILHHFAMRSNRSVELGFGYAVA